MGKLTSVAIEAILCGAIALFILGGLIFAICKREKEWLVYILAPILILVFTGLALFMLHTHNEPTVVTYTGVYLGLCPLLRVMQSISTPISACL